MTTQAANRWMAAFAAALLLAGCFKDESVSPNGADAQPGSGSQPAPPTGNAKPSISGTPVTVILQGERYEFRPDATDPDGDSLVFSIQNKPAWARFDTTSGMLDGTAGAGDVGSYTDIRISVSDGKATAQLSAFTLQVEQVGTGSATLSWTPPTENTDGSALTDLAGYKIYYGRSPDSLDRVVDVTSAGMTSYVVENLTPATWYFSMTSYNASRVESTKSEAVSKTVS